MLVGDDAGERYLPKEQLKLSPSITPSKRAVAVE
jgi:hypothetical protein